MPDLINRPDYLNNLKLWKDKSDLIKIVTGIRRCGKSTLFLLFQNYLKKNDAAKNQIININLELADNEALLNWKKLHKYVEDKLAPNKMNYVFIDEIQLVSDFPKAINSLRLKNNVDLYVTGSNAYMFSQKITTLLSGRFIEIKMLPLSFKEYVCSFENKSDLNSLYDSYVKNSAFPQTLVFNNDEKLIQDYLVGLYNTVIQKDILLRGQFKDTSRLENVVRFLFDNIGSETSVRNISSALLSDGRKIHPQTIEGYIQGLIDSYLLYRVEKYDTKGKQYLKSNSKYYIADIGMRYALLGRNNSDTGHILENIVYLELLRRGYRVSVGKYGNKEIDFVAQQPGGKIKYYQAAQSVLSEETLKRELAPLQSIDDNYPKYLLSRDYNTANYNGIRHINVLDWLVGNNRD
jgi:predicted AAA+ superfamily ATPase